MEKSKFQLKESTAKSVSSGWLLSSDRWIQVRAQLNDHSMTLAQVPAREFYSNAKTFVDTVTSVTRYYGIDTSRPAADVYNFEIEAMGGKLIYGNNSMPTIDFRDPLIKKPEDLNTLKTPDFFNDGRLHYSLDCIKLRSQAFNDYTGNFCAPLSMAVGLRSYPVLIKDMRKRPEFTHKLFTFIIDDVLMPFIKVQKEYCGVSRLIGADAWATVPNLSIRELKEWVLPYNQSLMAKAKEYDIIIMCNSAEYCEERLDNFNAGILHNCFNVQLAIRESSPFLMLTQGRWHEYPLEAVLEYTATYRKRGIIIGIILGISALLLRDGPVEKIVSTVKRFIDTFGRDHDLTISLANVPADTPHSHVHAAVDAVHSYGRKPVADDLDTIDFMPPVCKSYSEWKETKLAG